jgi:hypothetical protein
VNRAKQHNRFQSEVDVACYTGRYVVVQAAVRAGDDMKIFAQIQNIRREGGKSEEKDNEKQCFPFMKPSSSHGRFSCLFCGEGSRIKNLVKSYRAKGFLAVSSVGSAANGKSDPVIRR